METNFTAPNSRMLGSLNVNCSNIKTSTCGIRWYWNVMGSIPNHSKVIPTVSKTNVLIGV